MELAGWIAKRDDGAEGRTWCDPTGNAERAGVSDRRFYAAGKRAEDAGGFYIQRKRSGEGPREVLEEGRKKTKRQSGELPRKTQGAGAGGGRNDCGKRYAGAKAAETLRAGAAGAKYVL